MIDPRIRLRHLRCFIETARLGSLSAAAQALSVSQPAASKTIRELEDILGTVLFDRTTRRLSLTPAGRIFQQHTGAGLIELRRAQDLVRDAPKEVRKIAIGVLPTAATELVPAAALMFHAAFPDCQLRVSTGPNWLLMSQLREGALDLVVGRMATAKVMEGLTFRQLYSEQIGAIVRPGHPLCKDGDAMDRLGEFPLIVPPPGAVIAPLVRTFLARMSVPVQSHSFETVSLAFGRKLVQSSDAVWFISKGVVANELDEGSLAEIALGEALYGSPVGISMREDGAGGDLRDGLVDALTRASGQFSGFASE